MARKKKVAESRFIGADSFKGERIRLPPGSVPKGRDDGGRLLYQNGRLGQWYAVVKIPGGWTVFKYSGDCNCGS